MRCVIPDLLACIKSTRTQESLAWRNRQLQGAAASQRMPRAKKLHLFTAELGLSRFAQCRKVPRGSQAWLLVPASGQWVPRSRMYMPCELHSQAVIPCPVFSSQLKLGRMEMRLLSHTSMHREGTELTLLCTFTPELPLKCFLRWFLPLPQLNICIELSKNLFLNLQDKIILKYLHCI